MFDPNLYIIMTFRKPTGEASYFSVLTQRSFKTREEARTDVRELFKRKLACEQVRQGEGYFKFKW